MSLDIDTPLNGVVSHSLASGWFERVNTAEPKNAPGHGLTSAIWVQDLTPLPAASGLNSTTGRLTLMQRIYSNMLQEPQDMIDPNVTKATSALFTAYSSDFELGGSVRNIDLLGKFGVSLSMRSGYITIGQTIYRCQDITIPLIINDLFTQAA